MKRCLSHAPKSLGALSLAPLLPARPGVCRTRSGAGGSRGRPLAGSCSVQLRKSMMSCSVCPDNITHRALGYCDGPLVPVNATIASTASLPPFWPRAPCSLITPKFCAASSMYEPVSSSQGFPLPARCLCRQPWMYFVVASALYQQKEKREKVKSKETGSRIVLLQRRGGSCCYSPQGQRLP